jgi:hypothetical protein
VQPFETAVRQHDVIGRTAVVLKPDSSKSVDESTDEPVAYRSTMSNPEESAVEPPDVYIVLDAIDVEAQAAFWAEALHYRRVDRVEQYAVLVPLKGRSGSVFLVQGVPETKQTKNRMHLDLHVADPGAEVERLVALGATRLGDGKLGDIEWVTMADPEGNEFDIGKR